MQITDIFQSWGTEIRTNYQEFMSASQEYWTDLVLSRNLLLIRGLGKDLTDEEFYRLGQKFGRVWTRHEYQRPFVNKGRDPTLRDGYSTTPVSYFQSHNNAFGAEYMAYHADMPHVNELSYPGRVLYMAENTQDGSGTTTWLNLEHGWQQCSPSEQGAYLDLTVVHQDMYVPGARLEKFPFLKTNPKTLRLSPRVNCWYMGPPRSPGAQPSLAWIHHLERSGRPLDPATTGGIITEVYALLESKKDTVYQHTWQDGDIIVYDNWFNVHRRDAVNDATAKSGRRLLKRLTFNFI